MVREHGGPKCGLQTAHESCWWPPGSVQPPIPPSKLHRCPLQQISNESSLLIVSRSRVGLTGQESSHEAGWSCETSLPQHALLNSRGWPQRCRISWSGAEHAWDFFVFLLHHSDFFFGYREAKMGKQEDWKAPRHLPLIWACWSNLAGTELGNNRQLHHHVTNNYFRVSPHRPAGDHARVMHPPTAVQNWPALLEVSKQPLKILCFHEEMYSMYLILSTLKTMA